MSLPSFRGNVARPQYVTLRAQDATGKTYEMKGEGLLKLAPAGEGTEVTYEGDVQVGGTIAAVGQRLIDATAKMMIKRFFDKLVAS